jgi:hypothetical protein
VNRPALLKAFRDYLNANDMKADWDQVEPPHRGAVNNLPLLALSSKEKQALLGTRPQDTRRCAGSSMKWRCGG